MFIFKTLHHSRSSSEVPKLEKHFFQLSIPTLASLAIVLCFCYSILLSAAGAAPRKARNLQARYRGITAGNNLTDQDLLDLSAWPVNVLRYSLAWHETADTATEEEYFAWLERELTRFDQILVVAEQTGYKVALQLFTPPGGFVRGEKDVAMHSLFTVPWTQSAFIKAWKIISTRYAGNPRIAAFHLLNEPAQKDLRQGLLGWPDLAQKAIKTIRVADPKTPLIVDSVYGNPNKINGLSKVTGNNIIFGFNLYLPYNFVKQGLPKFKSNIKYPTKSSNKQEIIKRLKSVFRFQKSKNAQLWIGEFSVTRWTDTKSAKNYLSDVISIFEENNFNWTYHGYRESDAWDLELGTEKNNLNKTEEPSARLAVLLKGWQKNKR
jgi:endoglucanase